jgi:hypothetical protein
MRVILVFLVIGICSNVVAQTETKWIFGITTGLNYSKIKSVGYESQYSYSPSGGFMIKDQLTKRFSVQGEINYFSIKSGSTLKNSFDGFLTSKVDMKFVFHYLDFPILVNYSFLERKKVSFDAGIGSSFKYAVRSRVDMELKRYVIDGTGAPIESSSYAGPSIDLADETKFLLISPTVQTSAVFEGRYSQSVRLTLRYCVSANDPIRDTPQEVPFNYGLVFSENKRIQTFSLLVQYQIGLKPSHYTQTK